MARIRGKPGDIGFTGGRTRAGGAQFRVKQDTSNRATPSPRPAQKADAMAPVFLQNPHHIHFYFIFLSNRQFIQYHWSLHIHELLKNQPLINYKISNFTTIGCCELSKGSVRLFHFGWTTELFYIMGHFTFISNIRALCPPYQQRA